jgi:hypothetical protein
VDLRPYACACHLPIRSFSLRPVTHGPPAM